MKSWPLLPLFMFRSKLTFLYFLNQMSLHGQTDKQSNTIPTEADISIMWGRETRRHPVEQAPMTAERSKLLRAKRNREAAHRSRTKNKIRQTLLEDNVRRLLHLNVELRNLIEFLLPALNKKHALTKLGGCSLDDGS